MRFKIVLTTYNPDIIGVLKKLGRKKSQFIEMAIDYYLRSNKGRETLNIITRPRDQNFRKGDHESINQDVRRENINMDEFL